MPNHNISSWVRQSMAQHGDELCERRCAHAALGFPLDRDELQRVLVPAEALELMTRLAAMGAQLLGRGDLCFLVPAMPGSPRAVGLRAFVSGTLYEMDALSPWQIREAINRNEAKHAIDVSVLSPAKQEALAAWTANLVREARLCELGKKTIAWFMRSYAQTTGHVLARWPTIALLAGDRGDRNTTADWQRKFRDAPRSLNRWRWGSAQSAEVADYERHKKAMQLTDIVLTTASLLPEKRVIVHPHVQVLAWQRLEGDKG